MFTQMKLVCKYVLRKERRKGCFRGVSTTVPLSLEQLPIMNLLTQKLGVAVKTLGLRRGPRELAHFPFFLLPVCGEAGMRRER